MSVDKEIQPIRFSHFAGQTEHISECRVMLSTNILKKANKFNRKKNILNSFPGHGPVNQAEAKERMIAMEVQLSQLTGIVQKALIKKVR